jgi:histidyl-tRNA synthetase
MSQSKKKPNKLKARLPRGFIDRSPADIRATEKMMAAIREVYERYGFDPVETPMFEYTDALGKFLPDSDRPNEGVFSLQDDDEQWMSLRYDLTAPLARHVAENINEIALPYRTYRAGWVFRNEKPGPGRFRQFMQFDADSVGSPGVQADAEMCMMMADTMEALGLKGQYIVRVNNRKVLDGVMEATGVTDDTQKLAVLRAFDKLDKLGVEGVRLLLGEGRKDESGDFTKGARLSPTQISANTAFISARVVQSGMPSEGGSYLTVGTDDVFKIRIPAELDSENVFGKQLSTSEKSVQGFRELADMQRVFSAAGYGPDRIRIDPSVVRGLEYYTGPVYECELTFPVVNEDGETVRFGSVAGGGRYDGLVKRFTGQDVPATGFSIGVSRLMTALKNLGKLGADDVQQPVLVTVMDRDTEALGRYQRMVQSLRNAKDEQGRPAGIRAEMYQGNPKNFGNQLKYADRRGCPLAVIQGSDERARGEIVIKDLIEGRRQAEAIASNAEWRAARVAQVTVPEGELVAKVREMLAALKDG